MKIDFPDDHQPLVHQKSGPKCSNCEYVRPDTHSCANDDYTAAEIEIPELNFSKPSGSHDLPPNASLGDLCSDWWERQKSPRDKLVQTIKMRRKQ